MFRDLLEGDASLITVVREIIAKHESDLGAKARDIVSAGSSSDWTDLSFAHTPALRAAVGYQVCCSLLDGNLTPGQFGRRLTKLGWYYAAHQNPLDDGLCHARMIKVFAQIFLRPLVSYIDGVMEVENQILFLLSRYKQRSEWFFDKTALAADIEIGGDLEKRIKKDLLRYMFDNGIEFSVESGVAQGGSAVDILPVVADWGQLPIEVKVFDNETRDAAYVSRGLAQAADYGRMFNKPLAFYFIYNVANNNVLTIAGTNSIHNVVDTVVSNTSVHTAVANLSRTISSSQASKLETVDIPLP